MSEPVAIQKKPINRAIIDGMIATIYKGRRLVRRYKSNEPLKGKIEN